ncbi:hypothetical protein, partial [Gemmatimonas sp.]
MLHPAPDPTGPGVQIILTYLPQLLLTHYTKYIERLLREAFVVCIVPPALDQQHWIGATGSSEQITQRKREKENRCALRRY